MSESRYYYKHFHCYQYDIYDSEVQDDEGGDWWIGTANGEDDAVNICKHLNILDKQLKIVEGQVRTYDEGCRGIYDDKCRLEKENEQLKKENKRLEKMNDNLADILVDNGLV